MRGLGLFAGLFTRSASGVPAASQTKMTVVTTATSAGSSAANQFALPLIATGSYYFTVDWGDGNTNLITTWNQAETTHTYAASGTYNITISGPIIGWAFNNGGDCQKMAGISQWGALRFTPLTNDGAFYGCANLKITATDAPNLAGLQNAISFFFGCDNLAAANGSYGVPGIETWDVSSITTFDNFFAGSTKFNQSIGGWNVANGVSFNYMFWATHAFNKNINAWNMANAKYLYGMFQEDQQFNQPLNSWNVSNVQSMGYMFRGAGAFNQNIGAWNTGRVTNMDTMFYQSVFDNGGSDSINNWDVHNVTNMSYMFNRNPHFARNIGSWNVGAVTGMSSMFYGAYAFNCDLSSWDVSHVIDMTGLFLAASSFTNGGNPAGLAAWNVGAVRYFSGMFRYCQFDPLIDGWNVGSANYLDTMLAQSLFKGSLAAWVTNSQNMSNILLNVDMNSPDSATNQNNYNATLIAWNTQGVVNRTMGMGTSKYTIATAGAARTALVSRGCSIVDGGGV